MRLPTFFHIFVCASLLTTFSACEDLLLGDLFDQSTLQVENRSDMPLEGLYLLPSSGYDTPEDSDWEEEENLFSDIVPSRGQASVSIDLELCDGFVWMRIEAEGGHHLEDEIFIPCGNTYTYFVRNASN